MIDHRNLRALDGSLAWLVFALAVPVSGQLVGPEFQVNSYTTGDQTYSSVAVGGSGEFVVVWRGSAAEDDFGVFGQRFDGQGGRVGEEFLVNTYTTGGQNRPSVAADGAGNFVVVWTSWYQDGSSAGIFGQRYDPSGARLGEEFRVNSYTTGYQSLPAIAAESSGAFVVVWSSEQNGYQDIHGQRFGSDGSPLGSEFQINSYTLGHQAFPSLALDGSGNFVVSWESEQDGSGKGVFAQRFNSAGTAVGNEFQVNTYTTNYQYRSAVAADDAGNFVVVWDCLGRVGAFAQWFDASGTAVGGEVSVSSQHLVGGPGVAWDGHGSFVVVTLGDDSSYSGVIGQRFDPRGLKLGPEFPISTFSAGLQFIPSIAANAEGDFVVAWTSQGVTGGQDGSGAGVFGQRLAPWIFTGDLETGDPCSWSVVVGSECLGLQVDGRSARN